MAKPTKAPKQEAPANVVPADVPDLVPADEPGVPDAEAGFSEPRQAPDTPPVPAVESERDPFFDDHIGFGAPRTVTADEEPEGYPPQTGRTDWRVHQAKIAQRTR